MKVIMLENVDGVGKKGEMQTVKDGFGRNYLLPRGLAMPATTGNVKKLGEQAKRLIQRKEKVVKSAEGIKQKLDEATLTIKKKTGVDGKLFGSVTPKELAEAIKAQLVLDIDRRGIRLDEPIKMTGSYTVEVHLEKGVNARLKVEIEEE